VWCGWTLLRNIRNQPYRAQHLDNSPALFYFPPLMVVVCLPVQLAPCVGKEVAHEHCVMLALTQADRLLKRIIRFDKNHLGGFLPIKYSV
jgi:hypothetical protein